MVIMRFTMDLDTSLDMLGGLMYAERIVLNSQLRFVIQCVVFPTETKWGP